MVIGIGGISLSLSGRYQQGWLTLVRMMFLLPCYQWGTLYRQKLEEKDWLPGIWYFGILLAVQLLLAVRGQALIYSVAVSYTHLWQWLLEPIPSARWWTLCPRRF